eukprot:COSAG06_NODE_1912_length_8077_cov_102.258586_11_plen_81_part_00
MAGAVGVAVEIGALGVRGEVRRGLRENGPFKQRFRYVCPECVLADVQFLKPKMAQERWFLASVESRISRWLWLMPDCIAA